MDVGVGETESAAVVSDNVGDLVLAKGLSLDLAQLEGSFFGLNAVGLETALNIVEDAEVLTSLGNGDDVLETKRVAGITADLVVDLDVGILVFADLDDFVAGKSVLQTVAEKD